MKWSRRNYYLDNRWIDSRKVDGILHTRVRDIETPCMGCDDPVVKGQKYVMLLIIGADPIHLDCYHRPCILGVKVIPTRYKSGLRIRGEVHCKEFTEYEQT